METTLYLLLEFLTFSLVIFAFLKLLIREKIKLFILFSITLLANVWLIAEGFNKIHINLRNNGINIELGHGSLVNAVLWMFFIAVSVIVILSCGIYRMSKKQK